APGPRLGQEMELILPGDENRGKIKRFGNGPLSRIRPALQPDVLLGPFPVVELKGGVRRDAWMVTSY
ncbi:MAG: hypothetical protein VCA36_13060, partial [Opitutales bacterium]